MGTKQPKPIEAARGACALRAVYRGLITLRLPSGRRAATQGSRRGARRNRYFPALAPARERRGERQEPPRPAPGSPRRVSSRLLLLPCGEPFAVRVATRRSPLRSRAGMRGLVTFLPRHSVAQLLVASGRTSSARLGGGTSPPTRRPGAPSPRVPPLGACRARRAKRGAVSVAVAVRESPDLSALRHVARTAPP